MLFRSLKKMGDVRTGDEDRPVEEVRIIRAYIIDMEKGDDQ